jgi:hypothetical protein
MLARKKYSRRLKTNKRLPESGLLIAVVALDHFHQCPLTGNKTIVVLLAVGFITTLLALFGWWDEIAKLLPYLSVRMDAGFYLVFSTGLLIIWLMMFFVFDRMTYWRIRPGQLTIEHRIGGGAESFDTNALRFQLRPVSDGAWYRRFGDNWRSQRSDTLYEQRSICTT